MRPLKLDARSDVENNCAGYIFSYLKGFLIRTLWMDCEVKSQEALIRPQYYWTKRSKQMKIN